MQTGGLALCSAKRKLNRDEACGWAAALENVSADIRQFLDDGTFVLDDRGQRMVRSITASPDKTVRSPQEEADVVNTASNPERSSSSEAVSPRKTGGLRVAT